MLIKATAGSDEDTARRRHSVAFGPVFRVNKSKLTDEDIEAINGAITDRMAATVPARERLARRFADAMIEEFTRDFSELMEEWDKQDVWDDLVADAVSVYNAVRRRDEDDNVTRAELRAYLTANKKPMLERIGRIMNRVPTFRILNGDLRTVQTYLVLFAEVGASFITRVILRESDEFIKQFLFVKAAPAIGLVDEFLVSFTIGIDTPPLPASAQMRELADAILQRANKITLHGFNDAMFETVRQTVFDNLYATVNGGAGAETIARELGKELRAQFKKRLPPEAQNRLMLWARTEGAVMQNDALMKRGADLGMDGKVWQTVGDSRVRDAHSLNESDGVISVTSAFSDGSTDAGSGSVSPYNCVHPSTLVRGAYIGASRVLYNGKLFCIQTRKGNRLLCTPNHPILTASGFKFARLIQEGDKLVCGPDEIPSNKRPFACAQDKNNVVVTVEEKFEALRKGAQLLRRNVAALDFYEDGRSCYGKIDVVAPDSALFECVDSPLLEDSRKFNFAVSAQNPMCAAHLNFDLLSRHAFPLDLLLFTSRAQSYPATFNAVYDYISRASKVLCKRIHAALLCHVKRAQFSSIYNVQSPIVYGNIVLTENAAYCVPTAMQLLRDLACRFPAEIQFDDVFLIDHFDYSGYVYDLESETGLMVTQGGVITKQCRCTCGPALLPRKKPKK